MIPATLDNVRELCVGMGWVDLGTQKNLYMVSFQKESTKDRLNIYFTTMTVTLQARKSRFPKMWRKVTMDELESILQNGDITKKLL